MYALRNALQLIDLLEACQGWIKDSWIGTLAFKICYKILEMWGQEIIE